MKALSIRQPWAWMILNAGKDIENRDWDLHGPNLRMARALSIDGGTGEEILLHAAKGMTRAEYAGCIDMAREISWREDRPTDGPWPSFEELERGGIVGSFRIAGIVTRHHSLWFLGHVGLKLHDVKKRPFYPLDGKLGFFEVPA